MHCEVPLAHAQCRIWKEGRDKWVCDKVEVCRLATGAVWQCDCHDQVPFAEWPDKAKTLQAKKIKEGTAPAVAAAPTASQASATPPAPAATQAQAPAQPPAARGGPGLQEKPAAPPAPPAAKAPSQSPQPIAGTELPAPSAGTQKVPPAPTTPASVNAGPPAKSADVAAERATQAAPAPASMASQDQPWLLQIFSAKVRILRYMETVPRLAWNDCQDVSVLFPCRAWWSERGLSRCWQSWKTPKAVRGVPSWTDQPQLSAATTLSVLWDLQEQRTP